jgi:nicotinic acid phosphoribosyltransferase
MFGIGTFLTNDFDVSSSRGKQKSKALNMVIKIVSIDERPCVKISDNPVKVCRDFVLKIIKLHLSFSTREILQPLARLKKYLVFSISS